MPVLKHHHRVRAEVTQIDLGALLDHLGVLADQKPANLRKMKFSLTWVAIELTKILPEYPTKKEAFHSSLSRYPFQN